MSWYCDILSITPQGFNVLSSGYIFGPEVHVGRNRSQDLDLSGFMSVSQKHATIRLDNGRLFLTDIGSTSGTHVIDRGVAGSGSASVNEDDRGRPLPSVSHAGERLVVGAAIEISHNALFKLGAYIKDKACQTCAWLRFRKLRLRFCHTHLNEANKRFVKAAVAAISGVIVSTVEEAEYVVASQMSTTIKLLTALVLRKTLVTPAWLHFSGLEAPSPSVAESSNAPVPAPGPGPAVGAGSSNLGSYRILPPAEGFVPKVDSSSQVGSQLSQWSRELNFKEDRSRLLAGFLVCLAYPQDEQYYAIISGCGATVVRFYDVSTPAAAATATATTTAAAAHGVNPASINTKWLAATMRAHAESGDDEDDSGLNRKPSVLCVFHDEMYPKRPKSAQPNLQALGFQWLSAAHVASAVLKAEVPPVGDLIALGSAGADEAPGTELDASFTKQSRQEQEQEHDSEAAAKKRSRQEVTVVSSTSTNSSSSSVAAVLPAEMEVTVSTETILAPMPAPVPVPTPTRPILPPAPPPSATPAKAKDGAKELQRTTPPSLSKAASKPIPATAAVTAATAATSAAAERKSGLPSHADDDGDWVQNSEHPPTLEDLQIAASARSARLSVGEAKPHGDKGAASSSMSVDPRPSKPMPLPVPVPVPAVAKLPAKRGARPANQKAKPLRAEDDEWDFGEQGENEDGPLPRDARRNGHASAREAEAEDNVDSMSGGEDHEAAAAIGPDGWITAPPSNWALKASRLKRRKFAAERRAARKLVIDAGGAPEEEDEDLLAAHGLDDLQPETTVIDISVTVFAAGKPASRKTDRSHAEVPRKDQRRFRKNLVRKTSPHHVIHAKDMDQRCFARESERNVIDMEEEEAQAEEEAAREKFNEEIFADRFAVKAPARVRR